MTPIRRIALVSILFAAAILPRLAAQQSGAQPQQPPSDGLDLRFANGIIAVVEDRPITVDDVRREIQPLLPDVQRNATSQRDFENKLQALQDDIIQQHVDRVLIVKEFYKEKEGEPKKSIPTSFIDNQLSEIIITQYDNDRSKFLASLRQQGKTIREYRREIEEDIIYGYMRSQQRKSQSVVSPVKVETFYNENKDRFHQEDQVHLRLIQFSRANGESDAELKVKANEVVNRLKNGEVFGDIAKEVSQDTRRSKGGDWGWQKRSDLKPELSEPLFKLNKGEVTDPILMPEGAFLMYVEERKHAGIQPLDEVRDQIERILIQQMARTSQEQWLERLRRNGYVKYY
jgi:peptidyl-prolyl cis-trans isomerase SurA